MQNNDKSSSAVAVHAQMWAGFRTAPQAGSGEVVLKPLSRPELGEIRIGEHEFVIGRDEKPFASCKNDIRSKLGRRHARILRQKGLIYLEDFESRTGTTVNRTRVGRTYSRLQHGDEICFGGAVSFRVEINSRARQDEGLTLTLTPKSGGSGPGLDIFVIAKFPFLVSNATFSRYKTSHSEEVGNLSPLHACISQKSGRVYIEDLGSSKGTFVDGVRLREHAVPLQDGVVIAFGGTHFVYEVGLARNSTNQDGSSLTSPPGEANPPQAYDKTLFMAAPSTFLQVFCDEEESKQDIVASATSAVVATPSKQVVPMRGGLGRARRLLSEFASLNVSGDDPGVRRKWWSAGAVAVALVALGVTAYFWNASERDLKNALAQGRYARAQTLATRLLDKHPDDSALKAEATEAALKANIPSWLVKVRARDFDGANNILAGLSDLAKRDADLRRLTAELTWLGNFERLISTRGGPAAPIRIYADEDSIESFISRWNEDTGEHQRALDQIGSQVPQFADWYGEALTHLRRLQSEASVYLPVIQRLKANIATELARDSADALDPVLKETAQKYPAIGGLDNIRNDLDRYTEIRREARTRSSGRLFAMLRTANFATPPFKQSVRELIASGELPPADLQQQYDAATSAWKTGNTDEAFAGLQKLATGPWSEEAAKELQRRQAVATGFAAIQQASNASDSVDQLLAFRTSLDTEEDVYFARATAAALNQQKDSAVARARDDMGRASRLWQEYRSDGAIDASQRVESSVSDQFRTRARLLAEANKYAQQGFLIYSQVDPARTAQWVAMRDEIQSETLEQRSRLQDLSRVVEPEVLRIKLALLGEPN
jgi:pSer/pThr/pTyr-binding forkhead associated (FHA) protein